MEDWAFALTLAAIRTSPSEVESFFGKCRKAGPFEIGSLSVPSRYSVGFRFKDESIHTFVEGIRLLHKSEIEDFAVGIYDYSGKDMPEEIAGAFLGTSRLLLVLKSKSGPRAFSPKTESHYATLSGVDAGRLGASHTFEGEAPPKGTPEEPIQQANEEASWCNILISEELLNQSVKSIRDVAIVEEDFVNSVERARNFSKKMSTPFTEAFDLALFYFQYENLKNLIDSEKQMDDGLRELGFSDLGVQISLEYRGLLEDFLSLGFNLEASRRLTVFAILSDLFGGMGSWNDQAFTSDSDQELYLEISRSVYKNVYDFFVTTLNSLET
ncbi:MAG: hypothetical protein COT74_12705 [Bdellovibrionales bacterium CG10_big_fil_rev_8_21_14_0_10_45_34]|nr:MAG: hypothetical protein COT74_12705 [Bdellovibrionales bacterium CG10_big_fil_rev_8_21_14_0_10_45_34]